MKTHEPVNFLPNDFADSKGHRRSIAIGLSIVLVAGSFTGGAIVRACQDLNFARRKLAVAEKNYDAGSATLNAEHLRQEQQKKLIQHAGTIAALIDTVPRSSILAELTNHLPTNALLMDVTLDTHPKPETASAATVEIKKGAADSRKKVDSGSAAAPPEMEVTLRLTGLAETDLDVAHYLSELSHSPIFREVSLLISEEHHVGKSEKVCRRFQMQMTVNTDAHLEPAPRAIGTLTADVQSTN